MESRAPDSRSNFAKAYSWAARIMTVALEMVFPGVIGIWLDRRLGTVALFTILGFGIGLPLGLWHLLRMTSQKEASTNVDSQRRK
jgi:F0F1-type ATP synthase assembly protein I